jgi:hypothetical protein
MRRPIDVSREGQPISPPDNGRLGIISITDSEVSNPHITPDLGISLLPQPRLGESSKQKREAAGTNLVALLDEKSIIDVVGRYAETCRGFLEVLRRGP